MYETSAEEVLARALPKAPEGYLFEMRRPTRKMNDIALTEENTAILETIVREHNRAEELRLYGLQPSRRLLLSGEPGSGKALIGEALAKVLGRSLLTARFENILRERLAETYARLAEAIEFVTSPPIPAQPIPVVALVDIDMLKRTNAPKGIERLGIHLFDAKRQGDGSSIIVAMTDDWREMDRGLAQTFEHVIQIDPPTESEREKILETILRGREHEVDIATVANSKLVSDRHNRTQAGIERTARAALNAATLDGQVPCNEHFLRHGMQRTLPASHGSPGLTGEET